MVRKLMLQMARIIVFISCASLLPLRGSAAQSNLNVRDGAGVQIFVNSDPSTTHALGWAIAGEPTVDIGMDENDPSHQLFRVRATLRLPNLRIAVLDGGSQEIRFFDPRGQHLRTVGGNGAGPGEYRSAVSAVLVGRDSIWVFDSSLGRITSLDLDGTLLGSFRLQLAGGFYRLAGTVEENGLLLLPLGYDANMKPKPTFLWDSVPNLLFGRSGTLRDTVGEFSGMDLYSTPSETGDVLFGRMTVADLHENELYISDGGAYEVRVYGMDGNLRRVVRFERPPRKVSRDDEKDLRAYRLGRARGDASRQIIERYLRDWPRAEHKPWLSDLLIDASGHIWVEEYEPDWTRSARVWGVISPDGRWLGNVQSPAGLEVMEIGADYVLGVWRDEFDVEHVRLYDLVRD